VAQALGRGGDLGCGAFVQDGEELIFLPSPQKISRTQTILQSLSYDAENRSNGAWSFAGLEHREMIELDAQNGKRHVMLGEDSEALAHVRVDHAVIEDSAGLIEAAVSSELGLAAVPVGAGDALVKSFGAAHDGAVGVANWKGPEFYGDAVSGLVS
jgi:hypothetical protein